MNKTDWKLRKMDRRFLIESMMTTDFTTHMSLSVQPVGMMFFCKKALIGFFSRVTACGVRMAAVAVAAMFVFGQTAWAENAPEGTDAGRKTPDSGGRKQWEIVVASDAPSMTRFAGEELASILSRVLDRKVPIHDQPGGAPTTSIILGEHPDLKTSGIDVAAIPQDGFVIRSHGNQIHIVGKDGNPPNVKQIMASSAWHNRDTLPERGTLNGVYEFLERYAGVRFYFPGHYGTIIPCVPNLEISEIDLHMAPSHEGRSMGYTGKLFPEFDEGYPGDDAEQKAWYYKTLDKLRLRQQTKYTPYCHGLSRYGYVERFGTDHPEYFALMSNGRRYNDLNLSHPGQLCFSSSIREEIFQDAKAYLTGQSAESRKVRVRPASSYHWPPSSCQPGYFDIMPQDGFFPCNGPECQKHFQGTSFGTMNRETSSKFLWDFFIDTAERLAKEKVPGHLTTMAYPPYSQIPTRNIPENLAVSLCPVGADAVRDFDPVVRNVRAWYEKLGGKKVWIWNNVGKFGDLSMPGVPFVIPRAIGHYYQALSPYISGAYVSLPQDYYLFKYINAYVASKVLWDSSTDVDRLLAEHYRVMFGPAAGTMEKIYQRFEDQWTKKIRGNTVVTDLGESAVPPSDYVLWNEIYSAREMADLNALFDRAESEATETDGYLERVRFMRKNLFGPLVEEREKFAQTTDQVKDLEFFVPTVEEKEAPTIDGDLDDPIWKRAQPLSLRTYGKDVPETLETIVRVLRDKGHLYISFYCEEPNVEKMVAETREPDSPMIFKESSVEVFLNPSGDRTHYAQIVVNPLATLADFWGIKRAQSQDLDSDWSSQTVCKTSVGASVWTVELAIPLQALGTFSPQGFPVNFARTRLVENEPKRQFSWSPYLTQGFHDLEMFGTMRFDKAPTNLVKNGDFSKVSANGQAHHWQPAGRNGSRGTWKIVRDRFVTSGRSLKLECFGKGDGISMKQSLPELRPNTEYVVSFHIRTENLQPAAKSGGALISIWDERNNYLPKNPYLGTMPWQKRQFVFRTGNNTNKKTGSYLALILREATGTAWFDDVRVRPATEGN